MITQAAIMHKGRVWTLPRPARHHHVIRAIHSVLEGYESLNDVIVVSQASQGFLDDKGNFFDRIEAAHHALACKQLKQCDMTAPPRLFSEDLW